MGAGSEKKLVFTIIGALALVCFLIAMVIEVGMQNGSLASGIAKEMGKIATVGLAPAVFGPLMNITGSLLASYWHKKPPEKKEEIKISESYEQYSIMDS